MALDFPDDGGYQEIDLETYWRDYRENPSDPATVVHLVTELYEEGELVDAIRICEQGLEECEFSIADDPDEARGTLHGVLACSLIDSGSVDKEEILQHIKEALTYCPDNPGFVSALLTWLFDNGYYEDAGKFVKSQTELSPDVSITWDNMGNYCAFIGDGEAALEHFGHAVELAIEDEDYDYADWLEGKIEEVTEQLAAGTFSAEGFKAYMEDLAMSEAAIAEMFDEEDDDLEEGEYDLGIDFQGSGDNRHESWDIGLEGWTDDGPGGMH